MDTLIFIALAGLPPLLSGPAPLALWAGAAQGHGWRWQLPLAAVLAVALNLAAWFMMAFNLDGLLPPGFVACGLTPVTTLAMVLVWRWARPAGSLPDPQRRWLRLGGIVIPVMQLINAASLIVVAPALRSN